MKVDVEQQLNLVELAKLDQELITLTTRAKNHPAREEISSANEEIEKIHFEIAQLVARESDLKKEAGKLEIEIEQVKSRAQKDQARIDNASNAKELTAMEHEVESLKTRQNELEDQEIILLEEIEALQKEQTTWQENKEKLKQEVDKKTDNLKAELAELKNKADEVNKNRQELVAKISSEILEKYQNIMSEHVGLAAARLIDGACTGCNISFSPIEVKEIKSNDPELILTCENCGCILVRV
ncbi:MAG: Chromosome partition protein Smc [Actinomycetota bacterium]